MKAFAIDMTGRNFGAIRSFPSKSIATQQGNGSIVFTTEEELANLPMSMSQVVEFYNYHNPSQPVKKFSDKATAAKRLFNLAQAKAQDVVLLREIKPEVKETVRQTMEKVQAEKAQKVAKAPASSDAKRGRKSNFAGKKLYPAEGIKENPRREGSHGHKSMEIIMKHNGITYDDFVAAGGRPQDLAWDIAHNNVVLK